MKSPAVSVIIPVYNRKKMFLEAVGSVLNQSFRDFEIVIADDCSEEDIKSAVLSIPGISFLQEIYCPASGAQVSGCQGGTSGKKETVSGTEDLKVSSEMSCSGTVNSPEEGAVSESIRVKWLRLDKHTGMAGLVRNRGVDAASADYIAFLDSDDLWEKDKLKKQFSLMQALKKENIRIIHTREKWLRGERIISQKSQKHKREGYIFEDALWKCIIGPSTVMLEKSLFYEAGGFRENLEVAEDYELWLRITDHEKTGYIDEMLTVKRAGEWDQLSEKYGQIEIFRIDALKSLLEKSYFSAEKRVLASDVLSRKCRIYAAGCRKRGKDDEALYYENLAAEYSHF